MPPPATAAPASAIATIAPVGRRRGWPSAERSSAVGATGGVDGGGSGGRGAPGAVAAGESPWLPEPIVRANASPVVTRRALGASALAGGGAPGPRDSVSGWPVTASTNAFTVGNRWSDGLAIAWATAASTAGGTDGTCSTSGVGCSYTTLNTTSGIDAPANAGRPDSIS